MQNKISSKILSMGFLCTVCFMGCYKNGVDINIKDGYETGAYLEFNQAAVTSGAPIRLLYTNIATATASIKVKQNVAGQKIDSVVIYDGASIDRSTWKKIKAVAFKDSAVLSVSGTEIAAARGLSPSALVVGTSFTFYNEVVTADKKRYSMSNIATSFESEVGYNMAMRWYAKVF
jgi:hypothetical protein